MDEDMAIIDSILREEAELNGEVVEDAESGWKTVKSKPSKRNSTAIITPEFVRANGVSVITVDASSGVFRSLEKEAEERRRRVVEAQRAALEIARAIGVGTSREKEVDDDEVRNRDLAEIAGDRKGKMKKKTPKVTVSEAATNIDADHLAAFLVDLSSNYEFQEDIQLTRFADYFGRAFTSVTSAQFPWQKLLSESSVANMIEIPLAHLPEVVYKISVDWINQRSLTAVGSFMLWLWDSILAEHASYQESTKGKGIKEVQKRPSKSMVATFMILAMVLRRKPDVLISLLPVLKDSPTYFEQSMLFVNVWMISQASLGDLAVGLYTWAHVLLPMLSGKSTPYTRDLILQLGERILSSSKAGQLLSNGTVRNGERLVPPSALEVLMRLTFPSPKNRIKATERFEAMYPTLKKISLGGFQSKKGMKQVSEQIFSIAICAAPLPTLSKEATDLSVWCLTVNPACCEQWDNLYLNNIEGSLTILQKLATDWKELSVKLSTDSLRKVLEHFRKKNQTALASKEYKLEHSALKDADKQCKAILTYISPGHYWLKIVMMVSVLLGLFSIFVATVAMTPSVNHLHPNLD